jgi:membrane-bound ClpP family serine protease
MSSGIGYSARPAAHGTPGSDTLSLPWVVGASLLMGLGLFLLSVWLVTFDLLYFSGAAAVVIGALMILDPRMGADHS